MRPTNEHLLPVSMWDEHTNLTRRKEYIEKRFAFFSKTDKQTTDAEYADVIDQPYQTTVKKSADKKQEETQ